MSLNKEELAALAHVDKISCLEIRVVYVERVVVETLAATVRRQEGEIEQLRENVDVLRKLANHNRRIAEAAEVRADTAYRDGMLKAAEIAEEGCFDIGCTMMEAAGIVRRTRDCIAEAIRKVAAEDEQ
jgi:uncharacterized coiled-coil protein SlyX